MTTNLLKSNSQGVPSAAFTGHRHIPYVKYPQIKGRLKVAIYNYWCPVNGYNALFLLILMVDKPFSA